MEHFDVIIIGAGPAGMTCGMYTARAGLKTLVLDRGIAGGQMNNTAGIENYPGFKNVQGQDLGNKMHASTMRFNVHHTYGNVKSIDKGIDGQKTVTTDMAKYSAKAVVIATGAKQRHLGIPGEKEYAGHGVSYCAVCDANFFKDQPVIVVGGGDSALTEAVYLSHIVAKVTIMVRKPHVQAEQAELQEVKKRPNISIKYNTEVTKINGNEKAVQSVDLAINHKPVKKPFKTSAVFIYIGMIPVTKILKNLAQATHPVLNEMEQRMGMFTHQSNQKPLLDTYGWVLTDDKMHTSIPGLYAIGDVRAGQVRQVATAIGNGAVAGNVIYHDLMKQK